MHLAGQNDRATESLSRQMVSNLGWMDRDCPLTGGYFESWLDTSHAMMHLPFIFNNAILLPSINKKPISYM